MQKFSYHCHSNFSDGHNTVEEILDQAEQLGWEEIGISDHLIVHKNVKQSLSWPRWEKSPNNHVYYSDFKKAADDFCRHKEDVMRAAKGRNIKVRTGAEVDYFVYNGWEEEFKEFLRQTELDYCISGNHFLQPNDGNDILDMKESELLPEAEIRKFLSKHFEYICQAIESKLFSFVAHIDYARKNKFCGSQDFKNEKLKAVKTLRDCNVATELSTKGLRKSGDFYPTEWLFAEIVAQNIPVVISDDAHRLSEMGFEFAKAEEFLDTFSYKNRWQYKK